MTVIDTEYRLPDVHVPADVWALQFQLVNLVMSPLASTLIAALVPDPAAAAQRVAAALAAIYPPPIFDDDELDV